MRMWKEQCIPLGFRVGFGEETEFGLDLERSQGYQVGRKLLGWGNSQSHGISSKETAAKK